MIFSSKRFGLVVLAGLGFAAAAVTTGMANPATSSLQCGIATSTQNGMLAIQGTVVSPVATSGEYRFAVRSQGNGGSSNINQGGMFTASGNAVTTVGQVMVNAGAKVTVDFEVTTGGKTLNCNPEVASLR